MEITIIVTIAGLAISVAAFFGGKLSAAHKYGERWGRLDKTLENLDKDVSEVKSLLSEFQSSTKESLADVHERIDDHLRGEHGMNIPKRRR